jgi:spermidine synthase
VRFLHFGTEWVQGAMRIRKPDWLELEYAQQMMSWMLFLEQPRHVVQLGLGTGALTKFAYRQFPEARVTAVELNPSVIAICNSMFKLPPEDERLQVLEMDALDFVNDPARLAGIDALQVDLYDATARGPVLDTAEFYQSCAACLTDHGVMTVNLFGEHPSYARNLKAMRFAFAEVLCLPEVHEGNVVALAFKRRGALDFPALYERAQQIHGATKLPAKSWVNGLKARYAPA